MDLHCTAPNASVCDAQRPALEPNSVELSSTVAGAVEPHFPPVEPVLPPVASASSPVPLPSPPKARQFRPGSEEWMAERTREKAELDKLEARITELWGPINAATAQFLALLAEFDRKEGWAQHGVASCAHWLNWQCGISSGAAREKVRTARALESLPKIRKAFSAGRLSYSKVRAVTRVATAETEDSLLNIALHGTAAHVERTVRGFRRVQRELERNEARELHERRYLDCRREADGSVKLEACLPAELGEMLLKALDAAQAELDERDQQDERDGRGKRDERDERDERGECSGDAEHAGTSAEACAANSNAETADVSAETYGMQSAQSQRSGKAASGVSAETPRISVSQRRADALGHILEGFLAGKCSGSANGAHEVVVHIAHDALCDVPESSGASFEHGGCVAVETARRLSCDGALVGVVKGAKGEPLAVGRRTRAVPPAIRRALRVRDGGCRFPGCDRSRYVHAHHIRHWADGGETALGNLVTLCSFHHRQVHEGGYGVRVRGGEIEFLRPDGRVLPPAGTALGAFPRRSGMFLRSSGAFPRKRLCGGGGESERKCKGEGGGERKCTGEDRGVGESEGKEKAKGEYQGKDKGKVESEVEDRVPSPGGEALAAFNAARGLDIDAGTARCGWGGERMDYDIAIDGLCWEAGYR